jgi:hypothetical protein
MQTPNGFNFTTISILIHEVGPHGSIFPGAPGNHRGEANAMPLECIREASRKPPASTCHKHLEHLGSIWNAPGHKPGRRLGGIWACCWKASGKHLGGMHAYTNTWQLNTCIRQCMLEWHPSSRILNHWILQMFVISESHTNITKKRQRIRSNSEPFKKP